MLWPVEIHKISFNKTFFCKLKLIKYSKYLSHINGSFLIFFIFGCVESYIWHLLCSRDHGPAHRELIFSCWWWHSICFGCTGPYLTKKIKKIWLSFYKVNPGIKNKNDTQETFFLNKKWNEKATPYKTKRFYCLNSEMNHGMANSYQPEK